MNGPNVAVEIVGVYRFAGFYWWSGPRALGRYASSGRRAKLLEEPIGNACLCFPHMEWRIK